VDARASHPPGACHFPQYGEEYFRQLTAERLVTRIVKGFPRGSWEKEPGRRNEALDCRVYSRAAAAIYGLDRFEEHHWRRMEEALRARWRMTSGPTRGDIRCDRAGAAGDPQRLHGAVIRGASMAARTPGRCIPSPVPAEGRTSRFGAL
jgi:phage terminase large subunit GpA-like protein